jgi:acyl-CoA dehydrogenase
VIAYGPDHVAFRETVRRFLAVEVPGPEITARAFARAGEAGILGLAAPEQHGGSAMNDPLFGAVIADEAMADGRTAAGLLFLLHAMVAVPLLSQFAPSDLAATWLAGLADGTLRVAFADVDNLELADAYVTGAVASVIGANDADLLLVAHADGVAVVASSEVDRVPVCGALGLPGSGLADVAMHDVPPIASLPVAAMTQFRSDHDLWCACLAVAGARSALRTAVAYVQDRSVFGRPLAEFENTRWTLVTVATELAAASELLDRCLVERVTGAVEPSRASSAVLTATEVHRHAADLGLQLHGGYGYMREYAIAQIFADAQGLALVAVPAGGQRSRVAAALGL